MAAVAVFLSDRNGFHRDGNPPVQQKGYPLKEYLTGRLHDTGQRQRWKAGKEVYMHGNRRVDTDGCACPADRAPACEGDELPADFVCPWCKHPASDFKRLE